MSGQFLARVRRLISPPTTRFAWQRQLNPYSLLPDDATIYDIGSMFARGEYPWGNPPADASLTCVDIEDGPGIDVVADAHDLGTLPDDSADCVIASGMLLHCQEPETVIGEFHKVLKPGGVLYVATPFISPHPAYPTVYQHFSVEGLEYRCRAFENLESGFNRGPASTLAHLLQYFFAVALSFNSKRLFGLNLIIFGWLFFWIKYFDVVLAKLDLARLFYTESYIVCRK